jgi:hypothetical protein
MPDPTVGKMSEKSREPKEQISRGDGPRLDQYQEIAVILTTYCAMAAVVTACEHDYLVAIMGCIAAVGMYAETRHSIASLKRK